MPSLQRSKLSPGSNGKPVRDYIVKKDGQVDVGPWVVRARSPRGAFRVVRRGWPHWLTNHLSCETHTLSCEGIVSNRVGFLLIDHAPKSRAA